MSKTNDFYLQLSALYGNKLNNNDDTIIFLDEIQVYPHLLSMLKSLKLDNNRFVVNVKKGLAIDVIGESKLLVQVSEGYQNKDEENYGINTNYINH